VGYAANTEALHGQWFEAMRRGDFGAAWRISDQLLRLRVPGEQPWYLPRHQQWVWDGPPLAGQRVLVRCYHGLGDTIQFARFLPLLDSIARETVVWAQPALIGLLATLPGHRRYLPLHDGTPGVEHDVDIEIMELAHALRVQPESLAQSVPYFITGPAGPRVSERFSVGLVAAAGDWDARRSIPAELLRPLTHSPRLATFNFQLEQPLGGMPDLSTPDLLLLARRLRALDLVITPDTMLAHLAGALAVPTWVLLPAEADWRWMAPDRTDSPWYPTLRLFRQEKPGAWPAVVEQVVAALSTITTRQMFRSGVQRSSPSPDRRRRTSSPGRSSCRAFGGRSAGCT